MADERTRKNPGEAQQNGNGRGQRKALRALRKRYAELEKRFDELAELFRESNSLLLGRTTEQREELDAIKKDIADVNKCLYGNKDDSTEKGLRSIVDLHSKLWRWVPTLGGGIWTVIAGLILAGVAAYFGWGK